jgi:galactose-1-phosphate uridylyltransferase
MAFSRKGPEPGPDVETNVWACKKEDCNGWIRENFSFDKEPACPFCSGDMEKEVRMLPELENEVRR